MQFYKRDQEGDCGSKKRMLYTERCLPYSNGLNIVVHIPPKKSLILLVSYNNQAQFAISSDNSFIAAKHMNQISMLLDRYFSNSFRLISRFRFPT